MRVQAPPPFPGLLPIAPLTNTLVIAGSWSRHTKVSDEIAQDDSGVEVLFRERPSRLGVPCIVRGHLFHYLDRLVRRGEGQQSLPDRVQPRQFGVLDDGRLAA